MNEKKDTQINWRKIYKDVRPLHKKNYLETIKSAAGIKIFKHVYALVDGEEKDIAEGGNLSCALFVAMILLRFTSVAKNFKLISEIHITVKGTIDDLMKNGWFEISELKDGAIIVWTEGKDNMEPHIGFYLGNSMAISNSDKSRESTIHHIDDGGREIAKIFWHDFLN